MPVNQFSNYPGGFSHGVTIRGVPVLTVAEGNSWYVHSVTGSDGGGADGSITRPFATLDYAIGRATANNGDVIYLKARHVETISNSTAMAWDVAGISIVGLGTGTARPTFTFDTANTARIGVTANNISVDNCIFIGNFLSIATCFLVGAAADFSVNNCAFRDTSAILGFLTIVTTTVSTTSDGLTFTNNLVRSDATTTPGPAVSILNTIRRVNVSYNYVVHTVASNNISALIEHAALVVDELLCAWNYVYSINTDTATGAILVKTTAITGSGLIMHNRVRAQDVAAAIVVTAGAVQYGCFDNLYTGETTLLSGFVLPAIGTDA